MYICMYVPTEERVVDDESESGGIADICDRYDMCVCVCVCLHLICIYVYIYIHTHINMYVGPLQV